MINCWNIYDALAMIYDANVNCLVRHAKPKDKIDAAKILHEIADFSTLADTCRLKARSAKPIANTNDNPTKDDVKRRVAALGNLNLRQYDDDGYALMDVVTQQFLPPTMPINLFSLKEIDDWLAASGVPFEDDDNAPFF